MPSIDESAKAWELELSGRVGAAVQARRKALKLTALDLADKCRELGYPITRQAISKIESNNRRGKIDLAELLVLAEALQIPPALLVFPDYPDGHVEALPGRDMESAAAVDWLSGVMRRGAGGGGMIHYPNKGVELVECVEAVAETENHLARLQRMLTAKDATPDAVETTRRLIQTNEKQLAMLRTDVWRAKQWLWGAAQEQVERALQQLEQERAALHAEWVATPEGAARYAEWLARRGGEVGSDE
jgi:transcriptional regulator with XRE-family HTH domain